MDYILCSARKGVSYQMARLGQEDYSLNILLRNINADYCVWVKNQDMMYYDFYLDYAIKRFLREEY